MGRTRSSLTPMIGLSLAALVAGSLITLAVLAQRVSLDVPISAPVLPRRPTTAASAPPLVVENPPPAFVADVGPRRAGADGPPDRVLPLRIGLAAQPAPSAGKDRKGGDGRDGGKSEGGNDKGKPEGPIVAALPPGIAKKVDNGGDLPPGHKRQVAAAAPPLSSNGQGRGSCDAPPCGKGH